MFGRVKSLEAILATAQNKSLHHTLGACQVSLHTFTAEAI